MLLEGLRLIEDVVIAIGPWASLLIVALLVLIIINQPKHETKEW